MEADVLFIWWHLLNVLSYASCLLYIISFNPHNKPKRHVKVIKLGLNNKCSTLSHSSFSPRSISYSEHRKVWSLNSLTLHRKSTHKNINLPLKTFSLLANKWLPKRGLDQNIQVSCFMETQLKDWELSKC